MALLTRTMSTVEASVLSGVSIGGIACALLVNILDAVPLHGERLGDINLLTLGGFGDLEGW